MGVLGQLCTGAQAGVGAQTEAEAEAGAGAEEMEAGMRAPVPRAKAATIPKRQSDPPARGRSPPRQRPRQSHICA